MIQTEPPADSEAISGCIMFLRGRRVLLDADLARIYGVPTKRLNEQVKRNARRFPEDFMFQLTRGEAQTLARLRSQNATLKKGQHMKHLPYVFTEHGAIQAANTLNSDAAIEMSVHVVRAFVRMRQWLETQGALAAKLEELEDRIGAHDDQLAAVIEALRELMAPEGPGHGRRIGFHPSTT